LLITFRRDDLTAKIGQNLRRIFLERGHDFFDQATSQPKADVDLASQQDNVAEDPEVAENTQPMTPQELFKMRVEILPQLQ